MLILAAMGTVAGGLQPAGWRTTRGEIWFASLKGAVRFHPEEAPPKRWPWGGLRPDSAMTPGTLGVIDLL